MILVILVMLVMLVILLILMTLLTDVLKVIDHRVPYIVSCTSNKPRPVNVSVLVVYPSLIVRGQLVQRGFSICFPPLNYLGK
jgi:biopolymer transport protein ExbD